YRVTHEQVLTSLEIMTRSSIYAWEEELRNGFLTLKGGHRVGLSGKVVLDKGAVKAIRYVSSLNIRVSREVIGIARKVIPFLFADYHLQSTLIISPPQAGKTTLLRDLIRLISTGCAEIGLPGLNVGVVDERSELAGCWEGVPQNDLGPKCDVLDCCPKAQGMMMLLRSMAPQVIVTDELGRAEDIYALEEAVNGGVAVLTTVHGLDASEVKRKPLLRELLATGVFQRTIILSRRLGVGTVEKIIDLKRGENVLHYPLALSGRRQCD
ncbi:MAG: stage III sporulation protein AA, partial [Peptococcaceae bacterium]|nr:stage III sporulation protein AA [Peptococcaceae bacterium]